MTTANQSLVQFSLELVQTMTYQGQPVWAARHIGELAGYSDKGRRFAEKVAGDWSKRGDLEEGIDFFRISASEYNKLGNTESVSLNNRGFIALTESGVYHALALSRTETGKALLKFWTRVVMPQIRRTGAYGQQQPQNAQNVDRERRLMQREQRLMAHEQRLQAKALMEATDRMKERYGLSSESLQALDVKAVELLAGEQLPSLLPVVEDTWLTASAMAEELGMHRSPLGKIIKASGLREDHPELWVTRLSKAEGHDKQVPQMFYRPAFFEHLKAWLATRSDA